MAAAFSAPGSRAARCQQTSPPFDQEPYTHPQSLVTIAPNRRLNLYCTGHGTPTVILDAGWGGPTTAWAYVQPTVARLTAVCSYDRAGQGFSDGGPLPRDTNSLVTDLHTLLHVAGIRPPYVFVGHSMAGLDGVLFADRYPDELAGMLLVDPAFRHQIEQMDRVPGVGALMRASPDFKPCEAAARAHRIPATPKLVDLCLQHDPTFKAPLVKALDGMALRPDYWSNIESEKDSFVDTSITGRNSVDSMELDGESKTFGSMPLIVLTASDSPPMPDASRTQARMLFEVWNRGHDALASLSAEGRNELVPHSGHYIQFDHPGTVIKAIRELVFGYRRSKGVTSGRG